METTLLPLLFYSISACITPGPNNIMLTASGANFGFLKTIPHMFGILGGMLSLFALTAGGLNIIFDQFPFLQTILKIAGACYLLYLAWKIATAGKINGEIETDGKPFTFIQAALFQFLNPKALIMGITAMSVFTLSGADYLSSALIVILVFAIVCLPSIAVWVGFGVGIGRLLSNNLHRTIFNWSMGLLTAATVIFILQ
jgi:threonine/homoserine/homoserine lactone efflux protein